MELSFIKSNGSTIAILKSENICINEVQDVLDLMADCHYNQARSLIVHKHNITPEFFDLKTGIAGEILQKFSTYDFRLAIVGDFSKFASKSLRDFIYESNKMRRINFVGSLEEAKAVLK
jgi:hypothetical protein